MSCIPLQKVYTSVCKKPDFGLQKVEPGFRQPGLLYKVTAGGNDREKLFAEPAEDPLFPDRHFHVPIFADD